METSRFDRLTKTLTSEGTRRGALRLLAALPVIFGFATLLDWDDATAVNGRRKRRKKRHQHQRGDGKQNRKGKRKSQGKDKDKGKAEECQAHGDCGADALCLSDGSCQACSVTCSGTPEECGTALQTALEAGGTVYVCPGTYQGGFEINTAVSVIGAGQGDGAGDTILDGNDAARVVTIPNGVGPVELEQLRITGGRDINGGGIQHVGTTLQMSECTVTGNTSAGDAPGGGIHVAPNSTLEVTRCTISDNHAIGQSGGGGGIDTAGTTTLTDCLVADNSAAISGGGILSTGLTTLAGSTVVRDNRADATLTSRGGGLYVTTGTLVIAETCRVTENTASDQGGGGIYNFAGTVTLQGDDNPSPIVVDNCTENCAGDPVPKCAPGGTCPS